jgi:hypothetical protein
VVIVRLALGVVLAGMILCACSTGTAASPKGEAPTVQVQAGHIMNEVSQLKPGTVGIRCTVSSSKCSSYGSASAPLVAGLVRASRQLQKLHLPAQDSTEASALNTQLKQMTRDLRQQPGPNLSNLLIQVEAYLRETESLNAAMNHLRGALHLAAVKPSGSSWMDNSGHLGG